MVRQGRRPSSRRPIPLSAASSSKPVLERGRELDRHQRIEAQLGETLRLAHVVARHPQHGRDLLDDDADRLFAGHLLPRRERRAPSGRGSGARPSQRRCPGRRAPRRSATTGRAGGAPPTNRAIRSPRSRHPRPNSAGRAIACAIRPSASRAGIPFTPTRLDRFSARPFWRARTPTSEIAPQATARAGRPCLATAAAPTLRGSRSPPRRQLWPGIADDRRDRREHDEIVEVAGRPSAGRAAPRRAPWASARGRAAPRSRLDDETVVQHHRGMQDPGEGRHRAVDRGEELPQGGLVRDVADSPRSTDTPIRLELGDQCVAASSVAAPLRPARTRWRTPLSASQRAVSSPNPPKPAGQKVGPVRTRSATGAATAAAHGRGGAAG